MEELERQIEDNRRLILENQKILKANQKKLKKVHSYLHRSFIGKLLYWLFIVGISFGAYFYAKPYLSNLTQTYQELLLKVDATNQVLTDPTSLLPTNIDASILPDADILNRILGR